MTQRMSTQDIVRKCNELKDSGIDWRRAYLVLKHTSDQNTHRIFRAGNTLFWIQLGAPHESQMFVFNADSYRNLFRNFKDFCQALKNAGFKKVWGDTQDMNILNLIKRLGYPTTIEPIGKDEKGRQLYRGTVNV